MPTAELPTTAGATPPGAPTLAGYRALKVWQRALDVAADAHRLVQTFSPADQDGLGKELRRAAAAVPAFVAAGSLARDAADHERALHAALGAVARLETLAALAERVNLLYAADVTTLLFGTGDVTRLLRGLARSVVNRTTAAPPSPPSPHATSTPGAPAPVEPAPSMLAATAPAGDAPAEAAARPIDAPPSMRRRRVRPPAASPAAD